MLEQPVRSSGIATKEADITTVIRSMAVTSGLGMFGSCQSSRNVVVQAEAVANAWTFLAFDSSSVKQVDTRGVA